MKKSEILTVLAFGIIASAQLTAEQIDNAKYFTIASVKVRELPQKNAILPLFTALPSDTTSPPSGIAAIDTADIVIDKIINMGEKIFKVIEQGRPVVNLQMNSANALPQGLKDWQQLEGWQMPKSKLYQISYINAYGAEVVSFSYNVLYTYGGNLNGKGLYLTQVTVAPQNLTVDWGFKFNAEASIPSVVNTGTAENPVASMQLALHWSIDTVFKHQESTETYAIRGDGAFQSLSQGN